VYAKRRPLAGRRCVDLDQEGKGRFHCYDQVESAVLPRNGSGPIFLSVYRHNG